MSTHQSASPNRIGIISAGVASLQLGLFLLQHHIPVTIYSDRLPAQLRQGRLPNTVALMGATRERNRALGIQDWETPGFDTVDTKVHTDREEH